MPAVHDPYLNRRKPAQVNQLVVDPAQWTTDSMSQSESWKHVLSDQHIQELQAAVTPLNVDGVNAMALTRSDFPLPTLGPALQRIRSDLTFGSGVALLRGLPVDDFGKRGTALAFWGISQYLGDGVWSQNKHGHVLGHVTNLGQSKSDPTQRGPYSKEGIPFHVDCADIVGLLCLEKSVSGGQSSIVSAVTVHNCLLRERPDLLPVLCEPYYRDRRDEVPSGMKPWYEIAVFHHYQGYFSATIEPTYMSSPHRFDEVPEMTAQQREALDVTQEIARRECFDMGFQRGDMQFLNNHVVFHSRRGYEDADNPEKRRHLLRIWLKQLDGRPLPDPFYLRHGARGEVERPGGIVGPDTVLNAPLLRT